jgi:DNA-binding IclR family transcriptional regulator
LRLAERAIHTLREQHLSGSMFVSIWSERGPVIVVRDEGTDVGVPFEIRVGYHSSLFHTATGQVFMTFMHEAVTAPIRALEKAESAFHGHAVLVPSEEDLAEVVAQIRSSGLAIVEDHLLPGMVGMAVPIFDSAARLGAVLTLIGRSGSADFRRGGKVATWMKEAVAAAARA